MHAAPLDFMLLSDMDDFVALVMKAIVPLLVFVFWILSQLGDAKKPDAKPRPRPQPRPQPPGGGGAAPQGAGGAAPQAAGGQADPLRQQVEAMLRQAEQEREAKKAAGQRKRRREPLQPASAESGIELLLDDESEVVEAIAIEPVSDRRRVAPAAEQRREPASRRLSDRQQGVAQHTAEAVGARSFAERTSHLGETVAHTDDRLVSRLHSTFDHGLGRLADTHREGAYQQKSHENVLAGQLAAMLTNPQNIRQAIVLNEILHRPEERW